jgi:hypothetical protein
VLFVKRAVALTPCPDCPLGRYCGQDFWGSEEDYVDFLSHVVKMMVQALGDVETLLASDPAFSTADLATQWETKLIVVGWAPEHRKTFAAIMVSGKLYWDAVEATLKPQANIWLREALLTVLKSCKKDPWKVVKNVTPQYIEAVRKAAMLQVLSRLERRHHTLDEARQRRKTTADFPPFEGGRPQAPKKKNKRANKRYRPYVDVEKKQPRKRSPLSQELILKDSMSEVEQAPECSHGRRNPVGPAQGAHTHRCERITSKKGLWEPDDSDHPQIMPLDSFVDEDHKLTKDSEGACSETETPGKVIDIVSQTPDVTALVADDRVKVLDSEDL